MSWIKQLHDESKVPTEWYMPVNGDGLLTEGTGVDKDYGYCYLPLIFVPGSHGFSTTASFSIYGFNPEIQETNGENLPEHAPYGRNMGAHPFFAKRENAVAWLKERGLMGEVMRYAHHKPLDKRVPTWEFEPICREYKWVQYRPWLTAGITDVVTDEQDVAPTTILGIAAGFELHNPDGTQRHVGGNKKVFDGIMDACEE